MPATSLDFDALDNRSCAALVSSLRECGFTDRAAAFLENWGIHYVGDLIQLSDTDLLGFPSFGQKKLADVHDALEKLGFEMGTEIRNWDPEAISAVRAKLHSAIGRSSINRQKIETIVPLADSLEAELVSIVRVFENERNTSIVCKLWGWLGRGPRTLESVGQEFGITRERVRQIAARVSKRIQKNSFETPWLERALQLMQTNCPAKADDLARKLNIDGLTVRPFDPDGLKIACEGLDRPFGLDSETFGDNPVYASSHDLRILRKIIGEGRRRTSKSGCANFYAISEQFNLPSDLESKFHSLISSLDETKWLDMHRRWFFSKKSARNRVANLASKVLGVCPRIRANELRRAISRSRRLDITPPVEVIEALVKAYGLGERTGEWIVANETNVAGPEPESIEAIMIDVFNTHGEVLTGDEFESHCHATGMNPISFNLYRTRSPLVTRLANSIYSKVGADVPTGLVESLQQDVRSKPKRTVEFGWTANGELWCAMSLTSPTVVSAGSLALPSFVSKFVQGEWPVEFHNRKFGANVQCKDTFIWSFRNQFALLGAEKGDIVALKFDFVRREVSLEIGGEDIIDDLESGDDFSLPDD